jgi:hypothetical protein
MKKRLLGFLVVACMCFITCGNEPPEPFYEGTPEDDAAIDAILNDDYPELLVTTDVFDTTYIPVVIGGIQFTVEDNKFTADSPMVKQHIYESSYALDTFYRFYDRWYAKDTTCTVYLWDTFMVLSQVRRDTIIVGHYDSMFVDPVYGDTSYFISSTGLDTIIPTGDSVDYAEDINGDGRRLIFLEPSRSTTPTVDPETNDTTYAIIEPFEWQLKRISYGSYYYPAQGDAPVIERVILTFGTRVDTIVRYNTDTTYLGHVMNRFKHIDSLLQYPADSLIDVSIELQDDDDDALFYASCNGSRGQMVDGDGQLLITGQGIVNLYFEAVWKNSYYYVNPNAGFQAVFWLIPIRMY